MSFEVSCPSGYVPEHFSGVAFVTCTTGDGAYTGQAISLSESSPAEDVPMTAFQGDLMIYAIMAVVFSLGFMSGQQR